LGYAEHAGGAVKAKRLVEMEFSHSSSSLEGERTWWEYSRLELPAIAGGQTKSTIE
jgi:hypothetical protein